MIVGMWRSTNIIFNLVKKTLVRVKKTPQRKNPKNLKKCHFGTFLKSPFLKSPFLNVASYTLVAICAPSAWTNFCFVFLVCFVKTFFFEKMVNIAVVSKVTGNVFHPNFFPETHSFAHFWTFSKENTNQFFDSTH